MGGDAHRARYESSALAVVRAVELGEDPRKAGAISEGDRVRVWPGVRPGRNVETVATAGETSMSGTLGVYVRHVEGFPGGFYALTHVQPLDEVDPFDLLDEQQPDQVEQGGRDAE